MGIRSRIKKRVKKTLARVADKIRGESVSTGEAWAAADPAPGRNGTPRSEPTQGDVTALDEVEEEREAAQAEAEAVAEAAAVPEDEGETGGEAAHEARSETGGAREAETAVQTEELASRAREVRSETGGAREAEKAVPTESEPRAPGLAKSEEEEKEEVIRDLDDETRDWLKELVVEQIQTVFDPEIPVNIYELGLIYDVDVDKTGLVTIQMTLTSPNCPAAQSLPSEVETKTKALEYTREAVVDIVWDPPWNPSMMSEEAQLELNML